MENINTGFGIRLVDSKELRAMLSVSQKTAEKIGKAAGARVTFGRAVRWKVDRINEYLNSMCDGQKEAGA